MQTPSKKSPKNLAHPARLDFFGSYSNISSTFFGLVQMFKCNIGSKLLLIPKRGHVAVGRKLFPDKLNFLMSDLFEGVWVQSDPSSKTLF